MSNNVCGAANQQGSPLPNFVGYDPPETIRRIPTMDKNLAMLLGILFTDGCVSPKWRNSWRIYFSNKSDVLISLFRDCVTKAFDVDTKRVLIGKTNTGFPKAVVNSKEIGNWLVVQYGQFRTLKFQDGKLPKAMLPVEELIFSGYTQDFLKAAFSCDGGISFYLARQKTKRVDRKFLIRTIFLSCSHPALRAGYITLLASLGIQARNVSGDNKIKIESRDNIERFSERVKFVEGVAVTDHSKFWRGYNKNQVLELLVNSYANPAQIYELPQFHFR